MGVVKQAIFAPEVILNLVSKARVRNAVFKTVTENDKDDWYRNISRRVQKDTGRTSRICTKTTNG